MSIAKKHNRYKKNGIIGSGLATGDNPSSALGKGSATPD